MAKSLCKEAAGKMVDGRLGGEQGLEGSALTSLCHNFFNSYWPPLPRLVVWESSRDRHPLWTPWIISK